LGSSKTRARYGRYHKLDKRSDGYKQGFRFIDFGEKQGDPIKKLTKSPWPKVRRG